MKLINAFLIIITLIFLPCLSFPQNNTRNNATGNSATNLKINNFSMPKIKSLRKFKKFRGRLPIKAWINWNENRTFNLKIINPNLPYNYAYPLRRSISFAPVIIPGPVRYAEGKPGSSVVNANSNSIHYRVLKDDSANYGVNLNKKYNFYIVFEGVTRPKEDFKAYGIIYINKKRRGTTDKGLITQRKIYRTKLAINRHLLKVKIVIRDKYQRRWRPLLNTSQPKEKYFPVKRGYITVIKMTYKPLNKYKQYFFIGKFVKKSTIN